MTEAAGWKAMDADSWFKPQNKAIAQDGAGGRRGQLCALRESRPFLGKPCEQDRAGSESAGTGRMEFTDARQEPVGWRDSTSFDDSKWPTAVAIISPSLVASELTPRMAGEPVQIIDSVVPVRTTAIARGLPQGHSNSIYALLDEEEAKPAENGFFVDFGKEFQASAPGRRATTRHARACARAYGAHTRAHAREHRSSRFALATLAGRPALLCEGRQGRPDRDVHLG